MKITTTIGLFMFAIPFLVFGMMHFMKAGIMAGMVPSWLPGGAFWVYLIGVALVAASMGFMMNKMVKISGMMLAAILLMFVMFVQIPMVMSGNDMMMQMGMSGMLKNMALAGAALFISGTESAKVS
jgi:uncharacterized membrane protein